MSEKSFAPEPISFLSTIYGMGVTIMWMAMALLCEKVFKKSKEQNREVGRT